MLSRRFIVIAAFVAAIGAVVILNAGAATSGGGASETIHLSEVAHASGIDFVHQSATLDPRVNHIAAHIAALGACVSVADVNNDGWPDRKSTRLNSSHVSISYAVFCLKKKKTT